MTYMARVTASEIARFRTGASLRLGKSCTLTTEASVSSHSGDGGSSHTLGAGIRVTDIFATRVFGSLRYRNVDNYHRICFAWSASGRD